jgi:hypothetical protein
MIRQTFNPKRRMRPSPASPIQVAELKALSVRASYGGSPFHKRVPGDFGLSPPAAPRPGKTLCDDCVVEKEKAANLLAEGLRRGLISVQERGGWPQNVWAVTEQGIPVESELDNSVLGTYHGFPMPTADPFRETVVSRWNQPI